MENPSIYIPYCNSAFLFPCSAPVVSVALIFFYVFEVNSPFIVMQNKCVVNVIAPNEIVG